MELDIREQTARYYDLFGPPWDDVPFYRDRLPSPDANVLELGCGTGRVLVPLSRYCGSIHGVDGSPAMLDRCREKIAVANLSNATVQHSEITDTDLGPCFDLIIAPFRVMQNLETDEQVAGLFDTIRRHLSESGTAILNVFHPNRDRETLLREWRRPGEMGREQVETPQGTVISSDMRQRLRADPLVLYPQLIYRLVRNGEVIDETVLSIAMRCWFPDEFAELIERHGFRILNQWGGYNGEPYGEGTELVIEFAQG